MSLAPAVRKLALPGIPFVIFAVLAACGGEHEPDDIPVDDGGTDASEPPTDGGEDAGPQVVDSGRRDAGDGGARDAGTSARCGDGARSAEAGEECDDGNQSVGDGCDRLCHLEAGFSCAPAGGACAPVCGDGVTVLGEACDDHNSSAGDGCGQTCQIESGWACPDHGQACLAARCGDGLMVGAELCDDGGAQNGDGCSASCAVESGWICVGTACSAASCGDAVVAGDELCDDGNVQSGDGCLADCSAEEPNFACPVQGGACHKTTACGDGVLTSDESCDDGNMQSGDGCSASCQVEVGYVCVAGSDCEPVCGDGMIRGAEQCDDGGAAQPGCSAACQLEPGYYCPTPNAACQVAVCGNGKAEGLEQCDDGDHELGDGCTPLCMREPTCADGECVATCGDSIVAASEACDDGDNVSGDGCSATCAVEAGFQCSSVDNVPPVNVDLPLVLRDFKSYNVTDGHIDFNNVTGSETGIVRSTLGVDTNNDGVLDSSPATGSAFGPVYAKQGQSSATTHGAAAFNQWYHDSSLGKTVVSTLRVSDPDGDGEYVFDDQTFYPLDGVGWQSSSLPALQRESSSKDCSDGNSCGTPNTGEGAGQNHNFGFTSELRFWFTYKGTEVLTFRGDDDVWVFIDGQRVIDLGGVHCKQNQTVTLSNVQAALGLQVGKVYEVVVYQAERHTCQSSYRLELGNFLSKRTECRSVCGDGIRTSDERCDDGSACVGGSADGEACVVAGDCPGGACKSRNDGSYGHCSADCKSRGPRCGDGQVDANSPEACDLGDGLNDGSYGGCSPDCQLGPRCGDSKVDAFFGEECDQGGANQSGVYAGCELDCTLGPRCGDGVLQAAEQCDDGVNRSDYAGCAPGCVLAPFCGDGVVQASRGETCDRGSAGNTGGYGGCEASCKLGAFCGDGHVDQGEECDDGNVNRFDGCADDCSNEAVFI